METLTEQLIKELNIEILEEVEGEPIKVFYGRASTKEQKLDRQLLNIKAHYIYIEKVSGRVKDRPELEKALTKVRKGDTLMIDSTSRLSRTLIDSLMLHKDLSERGIYLHNLSENTTTSPDPTSFQKAFTAIMATVDELAINTQSTAQRQGIEARIAQGLPFGRPKKIDDDQLKMLIEDKKNGVPMKELTEKYQVNRSTIFRAIKKQADLY